MGELFIEAMHGSARSYGITIFGSASDLRICNFVIPACPESFFIFKQDYRQVGTF